MKKKLLFYLSVLGSTWLKAQEGAQNIEFRMQTEGGWYASPWLWIIGAAIFIMLLVVLTREKKEE